MKIPKAILLTACAASAWVLAACGGGSGGNNATGTMAANANAVVDVACL